MTPLTLRLSARDAATTVAAILTLALVAAMPAAATPAAATPAEVGQAAPDFTLTDIEGKEHRLGDYMAEGMVVVLEWFNPDCPFVQKHHRTHKTMDELAARYADHDVAWLAVNSGAPGKQGAGLERNRKAHEEFAMTAPLLLDESGDVGRAYGAKTTPHMFVIDREGVLRYAGAIDSDRDPARLGETNHVDEALQAVVAGKTVKTATTRPYGCSVKYSD
ncbi:MAG: thioredoxin family protein [Candidatus Krumholzibacteriia bacterium]